MIAIKIMKHYFHHSLHDLEEANENIAFQL